ncbi:Conserved_hypothetical protein [Hexamita inflata]|uniref:Hyaluronan/mRNA-binding protein domain-containing protein n=1 Tax=Hexamita inflata TaxID=28002 RepID=A0AA86U8G3_9EUKA|nr:Conserved hypothetical protein [Hexamita inflata]
MSNRFASLGATEEKKEVVGRDSKRHEPKAPAHGRQYDRNSVKGERRFPSKEGAGKGGWGNPKDTRPLREETAEQKERRELREKEAVEQKQKHEEYLKSITTLDEKAVIVVAPVEVEVQKYTTVPADILSLGKETMAKKAEKKSRAARTLIMLE